MEPALALCLVFRLVAIGRGCNVGVNVKSDLISVSVTLVVPKGRRGLSAAVII